MSLLLRPSIHALATRLRSRKTVKVYSYSDTPQFVWGLGDHTNVRLGPVSVSKTQQSVAPFALGAGGAKFAAKTTSPITKACSHHVAQLPDQAMVQRHSFKR
ncbi:unnamed protein product, partial [Protopolystoma xenopodis]